MKRVSVRGCAVDVLESRALFSAQPLTPNVGNSSSKAMEFNGYSYFSGRGADSDIALWRTDGTSAGTTKFQDTNPGTAIAVPVMVGVFNSRLYYLIDRGPNRGFWRTDGTVAGTTLVSAVPSATFFKAVTFNGALYMALGDGIWRSDGTTAGTTMIQSTSGTAHELAVVGTDLFAANTVLIWRVRAAAPTTVETVFTGSSIASLTTFNSKLYFTSYSAGTGEELWKFEGSTASLASDIYSGASSSSPNNLTVSGSNLYFSAYTGAAGNELWKLNTSGGASLVADLVPGTGTSGPFSMTSVNGKLFFIAFVNSRYQLYSTTGTAAATSAVPIGSVAILSTDFGPFVVGNTLYFGVYNGGSRTTAYYRLDPTASTPVFIGDVAPGGTGTGGISGRPGSVGTKFYFSATRVDGVAGLQLFTDRTDLSSITGRVWLDRNADGIVGTYDAGLGGRTVFLDTDNDGVLDTGEPSTLTSAAGGYSFYGLAAGTYRVRQVLPANSGTQITPTTASTTLTLAAGGTASLVDFTNRFLNTGVITGTVVTDFDHNGVRDGIDVYAAIAAASRVYVDANNNGHLDASEMSAVAVNRQFTLLDVPAGMYRIRQVVPAGWTDTTPNAGLVTGSLADKAEVAGLVFTADPPVASLTLAGVAFRDPMHYDQYINPTYTPPLAGATMYLDLDGDGVRDAGEPTQTTDSAGNFTFTGLDYGTYAVRALPVAGTRPAASPSALLVGPTSESVMFGVYPNLLLLSSAYDADTRTMRMIFDRAVKLPTLGAVQVVNQTTGVALAAADFTVAIDPANTKALIVRPSSSATWPDGRYRVMANQTAIVSSGAIADSLDANLAAPFAVLVGDANGDAKVDFADLVILAQNYDATGKTFSQGNFDYSPDGKVDFADLVILAQHYNISLPALSAVVATVTVNPHTKRERAAGGIL